MKGLKPKNKIGGAFGSFGWSGESVKVIKEWLTGMDIPVVEDGLRIKNAPSHDQLKQCFAYGQAIAAELEAKVKTCELKID